MEASFFFGSLAGWWGGPAIWIILFVQFWYIFFLFTFLFNTHWLEITDKNLIQHVITLLSDYVGDKHVDVDVNHWFVSVNDSNRQIQDTLLTPFPIFYRSFFRLASDVGQRSEVYLLMNGIIFWLAAEIQLMISQSFWHLMNILKGIEISTSC